MRQVKNNLMVAVACVWTTMGVSGLMAQQAPLERSQWMKKVGASVADQNVLRETAAAVAPEEKVDFARKVIKAASKLPGSPDEKSAALVKAGVGVIAGASGEIKQHVIAEVIAGVPLDYLPPVTEELAKRFDQAYNKLSDDQYEKIASDTLKIVQKRCASTDAPSVRNTFAILSFLRGAKDAALKNKLIAQLPDERQRNLAAAWIPPAFNDKNYDALLAAADVDEAPVRVGLMLLLVGHSTLDALLADLVSNQSVKSQIMDESGTNVAHTVWIPLSQVRTAGGVYDTTPSGGQYDHAPDYGINRVPVVGGLRYPYPGGYQGQGTSVKPVPVPLPVRR